MLRTVVNIACRVSPILTKHNKQSTNALGGYLALAKRFEARGTRLFLFEKIDSDPFIFFFFLNGVRKLKDKQTMNILERYQ